MSTGQTVKRVIYDVVQCRVFVLLKKCVDQDQGPTGTDTNIMKLSSMQETRINSVIFTSEGFTGTFASKA